jgi:hypothetical protein
MFGNTNVRKRITGKQIVVAAPCHKSINYQTGRLLEAEFS